MHGTSMLNMNYYITKYFSIFRSYQIRIYTKTIIDEVEIEYTKNYYYAQFQIYVIIVFGVNCIPLMRKKKYFVTL